ncbi:hypothetical protein Pla108_06110 [Botrimarina colliarenosi]|uniref:Uncharacterized protein n=1 Tax=Botrimarina colliarenosi TaxID=2528001 RepID=A0A5C6AK93_9BACT|nr:hypothetical protein [Botrimarina colliarenosi]TWT99668.1 hypothetical protein Pla108_06110 [Botrimarina colliarenosi]
MSMGPLGGIIGSTAGSPLSQTKGATSERAARDSAVKETADQLDLRAEKSAGIGQTEEDQGTADRDADGRRLWERSNDESAEPEEEAAAEQASSAGEPPDNGPPDEDEHHLDLLA